MLQEGKYLGKAVRWGFVETTNGHDQFMMEFEILGSLDANDPSAKVNPCEPATRSWSIALVNASNAAWLMAAVRSLGYTGEDFLGLDPEQHGAHNFEGFEFLARCTHEDYQGQPREKWSVAIPRPKLPSDRLLALNARFGDTLKQHKEHVAAKVAAPAQEDPF